MRERLLRAIDGAVDLDSINGLVTRNKLTREGMDPMTVQGVREEMERAAARRLQPHHICLAVVLVEGAFVHHPLYLRNPAPVFGPEPGFNEVSRAISAEAIKRAVRETSPSQ